MRDELENWSTPLNDYILHTSYINGLNAILACTAGGMLSLLSAEDGKTINNYQVFSNGMIAAAASPGGDLVMLTADNGTIKLLNPIDQKVVFEEEKYSGWIEQISWSPDGYYVAFAAGRALKICNKAGDMVFESETHPSTIGAICWSNDNNRLACAYFGGVSIYDMTSKKLLQQMPWPTSIVSLSWSPDGAFICGGTQDSKVHFWPIPYVLESDFEMSGYKGKVTLPKWSYDGHFLATNCWNELILWKVAGQAPTGQEPLILGGNEGRITAIAFHPLAYLLASGSNKGEVILWDPVFSKKMVASFQYESEITGISWFSDASAFIVSTKQGTISVLESPV